MLSLFSAISQAIVDLPIYPLINNAYECLGMRLGGTIDIDAIIKTGQDGMVNFSQIVENKKNKKRKRKETDE